MCIAATHQKPLKDSLRAMVCFSRTQRTGRDLFINLLNYSSVQVTLRHLPSSDLKKSTSQVFGVGKTKSEHFLACFEELSVKEKVNGSV